MDNSVYYKSSKFDDVGEVLVGDELNDSNKEILIEELVALD